MNSKNYCIVSKKVMHDKRISLEAKGIYALMMSIDKEIFNTEELCSFSVEDSGNICKALKELQMFGYLDMQ